MNLFNLTTFSTQTVVKHSAFVGRQEFVRLLREAGYAGVPDDAKITMQVPGGGDYSNMTLDIDDMPITVKYITVEE